MSKTVFSADVDTRSYVMAMRALGDEVLPAVVAETLNETADAVTRRSLRNLKKSVIIRTKFTTSSLTRGGAKPYFALNKARGRHVNRMFSKAGSISPYLGIQDTGGTIDPPGRVPIPTLAARTGKRLEKSIAKRYNLQRMGDLDGSKRYFIGVPKGDQGPLGLYERYQGNRKIRMLRNLESEKVEVPATHWHSEAVERLGRANLLRARFKRNAQRRLNRMRRR